LSEFLRLGFDPDFAPFTCLEAGRPSGEALRLVGAMCNGAGIAVTFVSGGLGERSGQLARGEIDGLACMAVTPARRDEFDFSQPYLATGAALFTRQGVAVPSGPEGASGLTVATPASGPLFARLRDGGYGITVVGVEDYRSAFEAVLAGVADAAALNADAGRCLCERWFPGRFGPPGSRFMEAGLAIALQAGSLPGVIAKLDAALASITAAGIPGAATRAAGIGY
jgi:ABC-type amino acid transport substrate-binding protein